LITQDLTYKQYIYSDTYWRNLGVSYNAINELEETKQISYLRSFLRTMTLKELEELTAQLDIDTKEEDKVIDLINKLLDVSESTRLMLLLLNDFQKRKKMTITLFYQRNITDGDCKNTFAQLLEIFKIDPHYFSFILTYHYWLSRASGHVYHFDQNIKPTKAKALLTESEYTEKLGKLLKTNSTHDNNYKLFSYSIIQDTLFIGLLYKEVNDTSIPDFDDAVRNKQVDMRLFAIDTSNRTIEIKAKANSEYIAIKKFVEETCHCTLVSLTEEVFKRYEKSKVINTILGEDTATGRIVDDFLVDKVVFRSSPLKNSPEITIQTTNKSVWPTVADAHDKNTIDINSLKDLKTVSFKSMDVRRIIYSRVKDNGNIIFTMNDARMDNNILKAIKQKFMDKFGIPLFQEISNQQFKDGEIDSIDYVLGHCHDLTHDQHIQDIHDRLLDDKLLEKHSIIYADCNDPTCLYQAVEHNNINEELKCTICYEDISFYTVESTDVNMKNIQKYVKNKIKKWCSDYNCILHSNSQLTYGKTTLELIKVSNIHQDKTLQFFIADKTINRNLLNKLTKMMDPIVVIFVGQREDLIKEYTENCIEAITFGKLYVHEVDKMNNLIENLYQDLALRTKTTIATAATKAYQSMQVLRNTPSKINKHEYSSINLEDDGFTLIKDIFMNAVKWGKEKSGKAVPEGLFSISFHKKGKSKESYAFSFDFKLTLQDTGYDLGIDEQRKAADYVNDLNNSDELTSFTHLNELTGHIFISNHFKNTQKENIKEHFEKYVVDDKRSKPILITTDTLMYLHAKYREHFEEIEYKKTYFYECLYNVLVNDTNIVTNNDIDFLISDVLNRRWQDTDSLDTHRLTKELT